MKKKPSRNHDRSALVGLAQTALEAGNSESEARKSYNDAKSREEGAEWFELLTGPGSHPATSGSPTITPRS